MNSVYQTVFVRYLAGMWMSGVYAPVADEADAKDLVVTGQVPAGLRGAFLRNGPNPMFPPLGRYHLFDGDGMVHGLWFDGEGATRYSNRWIRSAGLDAEEAAGHSLFGGLSEFRLPPPEVMAVAGPMKNTANTSLVRHAGRVLALMEGCKPTEITESLDTIGEYDFAGALSGPMTAHPKVDPRTGEMVFFGVSPVAPFLRVHSATPDGTLTWSTEVELPGPVMMHDFVITATSVVIFDLPAVFDLEALLTGGEGIRWEADHGARIGVLGRGEPGTSIRWIDVDPFWVFHFLNAYDEPDGNGIVVHGCRADSLNTSFDGEVLEDPPQPKLHEWRVDVGAGSVTDRPLDDRAGDFPRIDERRTGLEARYGYLGQGPEGHDDEQVFNAVVKYDLAGGTSATAVYGADVVSGEPVFTPDPSSTDEDAGWILNWVHDRTTEESTVVILDAGSLDEVARVHLPRRVPFGFHGTFIPSA